MKDFKSIYLPLGEHFLSNYEVDFIEESLKKFPLEDITIGDAGEINNCQVGRLMEDQPETNPKILNESLSKPILKLFQTLKAKKFFGKFLDKNKPQIIRRSQFNLLGEGSFVGRHLDIDSNPNYQIAAVLQLGSKFSGGEFIVYPSKDSEIKDAQIIYPEYGSITISFCKSEHEVGKVTSGTRTSFVNFISNYVGKNKRKRIVN
ncbi:2OG-Fe(II) oxygenase [Prochlorococcus sp. MIT 0604]|uniref:2OG-Fe(II) oxygenase n=1 Tax=Prochlorococcus sp. MIT 0604 TaxID=1501268 RepID=UPI0004F762E7|nr:2OG-Fe(II) oxygenase [Prochlorococcus sp. MIT 0604]AIQ95518.1 hypothetical protein EW14_1507 [Prochlorococcus sp. MIT 0604]